MAEGLIGNYRIGRKLGEGGMGTVYLAEHALLGRKAALKVLLPSLSANPDIVHRFFNEARSATAIADPGIVQIFDFGIHTDGSAFIVMELLEGEPLDQRLHRVGRLGAADAMRIVRQAAISLQAAHSAGIVHRDLKPENIYLVRDAEVAGGERPKILDFGIAKLGHAGGGEEANRFKTRTGALMGTPVYMSPEQCRGAGDIDHRSDIYALGCVLFHLLVGKPPFDREGMGELIVAHLREAPPHPSTLVDGIRPEVEAIVLRCLNKAPADRFQHMSELVQAIGQIQGLLTAPPGMGVSAPWAATSYVTPPPGMSTPPPGSPSQLGLPSPTTLGSANGQLGTHHTQVRSKRRGWLYAAFAVAVLGGGAVAVLTRNPGVTPAVAPMVADPLPAAATPDAGLPLVAPPLAPDAALPVDAAPEPAAAIVDAAPTTPTPPTVPASSDHHHGPHHPPQPHDVPPGPGPTNHDQPPHPLDPHDLDRGD